jgi:hypothetical protein
LKNAWMPRGAQLMPQAKRARRKIPIPTGELLQTIRPALGLGLLFTPGASWSRLRTGRSLMSQTLYKGHRTLPRAPLEDRVLSQEEYFRPMAYCDAHAPEVITLSDALRQGAANDWKLVHAVFEHGRNEIVHAVEPIPHHGVVVPWRGDADFVLTN